MFPGERFSTYSKSQNIGFVDISKIKDSEVYNTVTNKLREVSKELESTAKSVIQGVLPEGVTTDDIKNKYKQAKEVASGVKDKIDESVRAVKDTFTAIQDLTNITQTELENAIGDILPNDPAIRNAFRTLARSCRDNALGRTPGFKPFNDTASCGTPGQGKCQSGEIRGFLDKLTNGAIGSISRSIQSILKSLIALGNLGYSGSLCKIFAVLANGMPSGVIQRGAASLLATFGGIGNVPAVMDISANMGNSNPSLEIPGLTKRITENFKAPLNVNGANSKEFYDGYMTAMDAVSPGSLFSSATGLPSIAALGKSNSDFTKLSGSFIKNSGSFSLSTPSTSSDINRALAYVGDKVKDPYAGIEIW